MEYWIFDSYSTGADLTKIVLSNICFGKIISSNHQKKWFSTILGHFWNIEFLWQLFDRRGPYKISENFVLSLHNCKANFWQIVCFDGNSIGASLTKIVLLTQICFVSNYVFHSSIEVVLHNLRQFLENCIFDGNSIGASLTKIVKILYYLKFC